jgi:transposase-like protein
MASRRSWEKAHSPYWSLHVEAWRRSGLSRTEYCRSHRLTKATFDRWLKHLVSKEDARKHAEYQAELRRQQRQEERDKGLRKRQRRRYAVSTDVRSKAVQAFWAMHVEAMNWSGMGVREYAAGLQLSPYSLRRWRDRFEDGEAEIDWRAHLHPAARPQISTGAKPSAKEFASKTGLTGGSDDVPPTSEPTIRRSFSAAEKLAIVLATEQSDATVSSVARQHGIVTSMLFRWRAELGYGKDKHAKLAPVTVTDGQIGASAAPVVLLDLLQPPDGMMAVELPDGRRVFAPTGSDPDAVHRHVAEREAASC